MTRINDQQMEATRRLAAKLQRFHDGLTEEEQVALDRAVRRLVAQEVAADTQGQMINLRDESPPPVPRDNPRGAGLIIPTLFNDRWVFPDGSADPIPVNRPG